MIQHTTYIYTIYCHSRAILTFYYLLIESHKLSFIQLRGKCSLLFVPFRNKFRYIATKGPNECLDTKWERPTRRHSISERGAFQIQISESRGAFANTSSIMATHSKFKRSHLAVSHVFHKARLKENLFKSSLFLSYSVTVLLCSVISSHNVQKTNSCTFKILKVLAWYL